MGYSPCGRKELDMTERLSMHTHMYKLKVTYTEHLTIITRADKVNLF